MDLQATNPADLFPRLPCGRDAPGRHHKPIRVLAVGASLFTTTAAIRATAQDKWICSVDSLYGYPANRL